jgi:hypothetical protein
MGPVFGGLVHVAVPLAALLASEIAHRRTIFERIWARVDPGHELRGPRGSSTPFHRAQGPTREAARRVSLLRNVQEISPEALVAMIPLAEPVNLAKGLHEMRQAARLAKLHSEVSTFAYAASTLTHPFGVLAATVLTSGVKLLNAAYKVLAPHEVTEKNDPLLGGASRFAEMPVMRPALNLLLKAIHHIDNKVAWALDPLKNNFAFGASRREQRLGDTMLEQYAALHNECFPRDPVTTPSLREKLLDPTVRKDICVVKGENGIVGGFTYFFDERRGVKVLRVTSMVPTRKVNAAASDKVLQAATEYAQLNGARGIYFPERDM